MADGLGNKPARELGRRVFRTARRVVVGALVIYGILVLLIMFFEGSFIYFPMRYPHGDWERPPGVEEVEFQAADGTRLHGWWAPSKGAKWTLLWAHGNGGNLTHRKHLLVALRDLKINVFIFDYRGYGKSQGKPSEEGLYLDAEAAWEAVVKGKGVSPKQLVLFGESLGTAIVTELALRRECAGMILEAPFTNVREMAWKVIPLPLGWALRHRYDTLAKVPRIHCPILVIHGSADRTIPPSQGRRVFEAANAPKSFFEILGAKHNDAYLVAGQAYFEKIKEFLKGLEALESGR